MNHFWEHKFQEIQTTWGFEPADSAIQASDFFKSQGIQNILIPGIGYGRNAKVFIDKGMNVTGIEISETAIKLAKQNYNFIIHHGSVTQMPFDNSKYDGIFCYALIHLLNKMERRQFLKSCFSQLHTGGYMIFVVVSDKSDMYGKGKKISSNRFEIMKGLKVYFYDQDAASKEFKDFGIIGIKEIDEPVKHMDNQPPLKCIMVKCKK